jgi:transposase
MPSRPNVAARRIFYVYFWIDPKTQTPFYVGKGMGDRAYFKYRHERCQNKLNKLLEEGYTMDDIVVMHRENLTEPEAYELEEQCISQYKRVEEGGTLFNYKTSKTVGYRKIIDPAIMSKIYKLYFDDGMNAKEVGKIIGLHETSVLRWIKESGRQTFHSGLREPFASNVERNAEICREYKGGTSTPKLAKKYKCCVPTILGILKNNNVEVLDSSKKVNVKLNRLGVVDDIINSYANRESLQNIAKRHKIGISIVRSILVESGINIRKTRWC